MSRVSRLLAGLGGIALIAMGSLLTWLNPSGVPITAMLILGVVLAVLAARGLWPTRWEVNATGAVLVFGGSDREDRAEFEHDFEAFASRPNGASQLANSSKISPKRLAKAVSASPRDYDEQIVRALLRLRPGLAIVSAEGKSRSTADFEVLDTTTGAMALVETKWRGDPRVPYRGSTLDALAANHHGSAPLLVVVNALAEAIQLPHNLASNPVLRVVGWIDEEDDVDLQRAVNAILGA